MQTKKKANHWVIITATSIFTGSVAKKPKLDITQVTQSTSGSNTLYSEDTLQDTQGSTILANDDNHSEIVCPISAPTSQIAMHFYDNSPVEEYNYAATGMVFKKRQVDFKK